MSVFYKELLTYLHNNSDCSFTSLNRIMIFTSMRPLVTAKLAAVLSCSVAKPYFSSAAKPIFFLDNSVAYRST